MTYLALSYTMQLELNSNSCEKVFVKRLCNYGVEKTRPFEKTYVKKKKKKKQHLLIPLHL
jgi:hypothetical protein